MYKVQKYQSDLSLLFAKIIIIRIKYNSKGTFWISTLLFLELKMTLYKRKSLIFCLFKSKCVTISLKLFSLARAKLKCIKVVNLSHKLRGKMF